MRALVTFIIGAAVGAVAALLLAPESGEEMRRQLEDSVTRSTESLQQAWQRDMQEMNERVASLQATMQRTTAGDEAAGEGDVADADAGNAA